MISSAIIMGLIGVPASFFPQEILNKMGLVSTELAPLCLQLLSAVYMGFAIMNWMAKTVLIGGIYARPLAMGNFFHFFIGAIALAKVTKYASTSTYVWIACAVYSVFALLFGIVLLKAPVKNK